MARESEAAESVRWARITVLAKRLRPSGLSLGNDGRDGGGERVGPGCADRVGGGAGLGKAPTSGTTSTSA
jgi:hypothetical protein